MRIIAVLILSSLVLSGAVRAQPIGEADMLRHIEILASDAFEGRDPGTAGENKTVNYIATQWTAANLQPAGDSDSWYAPVALVERVPESYRIKFVGDDSGKTVRLRRSEIILRGREPSFQQNAIPVVFAGYAALDDGQDGSSVAGKLVLLPRTEPKGHNDLPDYRDRRLQLIENGAIGVISIVNNQNRWKRFRRFYERGSTMLADPESHGAFEGLISFDQFTRLAEVSGLDAQKLLADRATSAVIELGLSADAKAKTRLHSYTSHNVVGKIAGRNPESGAILFMGHWDHLGFCRAKDPKNPDKDRICNGAVDNASGISLLIEAAKRLSGEDHDRDIYFLATTAEEKGLLGARAFLHRPPVALEQIAAVFNVDTVALSDDKRKIAIVGLGETELDKDLEIVAAQEGREIDRSGKADAYLKRQDGYVFLERNIPAFMITSAFADNMRLKAFLNGAYHDVSDEVNDTLVLTGAAADANFHVALGRYFASTATYRGKATSGAPDN
ncbi:M20/M25/M40 family metallo-hydrolase [Parasphingorhabdus sp.]|uniref:M20/M25/M40 family metallo-hydrolase n=1 Tax=Parasphingorhabdus sp. TaxID=2709688 RepID=UPI003263841B